MSEFIVDLCTVPWCFSQFYPPVDPTYRLLLLHVPGETALVQVLLWAFELPVESNIRTQSEQLWKQSCPCTVIFLSIVSLFLWRTEILFFSPLTAAPYQLCSDGSVLFLVHQNLPQPWSELHQHLNTKVATDHTLDMIKFSPIRAFPSDKLTTLLSNALPSP